MISRLFIAASIALSVAVFAAEAYAQTPTPAPAATPPSPVAIPPNKCVKPEYPGKLASAPRFTEFNKDFNAYGICVKKYVDDTKLIVNAAAAAVNGAVEDFNKFTAEVKALDESAKN